MIKCLIICRILIFFTIISLGFGFQSSKAMSQIDNDGDGIPDFWETKYSGTSSGLNPGDDNDNDGLNNYDEFQSGTHPFEKDSDEDGLKDGQEVHQYGTDPVMEDTDLGGMADGAEVSNGGSPLNPEDDDNSNSMTVSIQLKVGWNLISFPVSPVSQSVNDVLSAIAGSYSSIWSYQNNNWEMYNPAKPTFSDLKTLEAGWGYWIKMEKSAALNLSGTSAPKSIHLNKGWNLVGYNLSVDQTVASIFSSIHSKLNSVWMYKNSQWDSYNASKPGFSDLEIMESKYGYWIYTNSECDWTF